MEAGSFHAALGSAVLAVFVACVGPAPEPSAIPSAAARPSVGICGELEAAGPSPVEPTPLIELDAEAIARLPAPAPEPRPAPPFDADALARIAAVEAIVAAAAVANDVDPALVHGLIWVESKFEPRARGPAGAQGLMQLMPKTAQAMAKLLGRKRDSYDPDFNIHAGTLLLARLLRRFDGDVELALAAYNRGSGVVAGWVEAGEPLPDRTQAFVDRVLEARTWFEAGPPRAVLDSAAIASN